MIIDLERPDTWPEPLASYLATHLDALLGWERGDRPDGPYISAARYDQIVYGLRAVLQAYSIVGLHCTKLYKPHWLDQACPTVVQKKSRRVIAGFACRPYRPCKNF